MNKVIISGRLVRDAEIRYSQGNEETCIARFTIAVDRIYKNDNQPSADFISCLSFGRTAEFIERYGFKGAKFIAEGRIQTGKYTNKDGVDIYTTDIVVERVEFGESKADREEREENNSRNSNSNSNSRNSNSNSNSRNSNSNSRNRRN